ncbi:Lysophospholipid transporter LplT [bioreactor metagenome]|uniref:Lysophospholipid transporter LplT n=1 Tax=bioreactor metagenome TaxID=1076179 RepID=A0A644WU79_9ZZZZ|nr:MFS transporter [Paludibacter sp.]
MKKWISLLAANFLGVFNDNFLKNAIIFVAIGWNLPSWLSQSQLIALVSASLVVPYLILSPLGGKLAVHYSKLKVFRVLKFIEFPIMAIACIAFLYEWVMVAMLAVLLMGIQSCLYSPAKYGLIRDIGGVEGSAFGSGMFETMAFLGILTGTVLASWLSDVYQVWVFVAVFMLLADAGYLVSLYIKADEPLPDRESSLTVNLFPWRFLRDSYQLAKSFKQVNAAVFGVSAFWLIGALLQMNIVIHAGKFYQVSNTATGLVMAFAAIGIAMGTWLSGVLTSKVKGKSLMLWGLTGMLVNLLIIVFLQINFQLFLVLIFLTACFGGLFQVPNLTVIQQADAGRKLGQLLAYMNLVIFIFVLLASVLFSITMLITNDNSFVVFGLIAGICLLTLLIVNRESRRVEG